MESVAVSVKAKGEYSLPLQLSANTRALWTYQTEGYDIGFSCRWFPVDAVEEVEVTAPGRVQSHKLPQQGRYDAACAGTLTLVWDNTFSRFRSKNLMYTVTVEEIVGDSTGAGTSIVRTLFGPGTVIEERSDGFTAVDLVFGRAFLRSSAIVDRQAGYYAATSMFQLQRLDRVRSSLVAAGMTPEQQEFVTDARLMKYLLSTEWDVDKAAAAMQATLQWRFVDFRPMDLRYDVIRDNLAAFPCYLAGYDHQDRPIVVLSMDSENSLTNEQKLQTMLFAIERALDSLLPAGSQTITVLCDFKGFSRRHINPKLAKEFVSMFKNHYRRVLGACIIFNANTVFQMLWKTVEPLLGRFHRDRVVWLKGESDEASLKQLGDLMDRHVLQAVLTEYPDYTMMKGDYESPPRSSPPPRAVEPAPVPFPAAGAGASAAATEPAATSAASPAQPATPPAVPAMVPAEAEIPVEAAAEVEAPAAVAATEEAPTTEATGEEEAPTTEATPAAVEPTPAVAADEDGQDDDFGADDDAEVVEAATQLADVAI